MGRLRKLVGFLGFLISLSKRRGFPPQSYKERFCRCVRFEVCVGGYFEKVKNH
jgi:hypothetical protein